MFGQEVFKSSKKVGSETTFGGVGTLNGVLAEESGEKALSQLFCFVFCFSFPLQETKDRGVVGLAEVRERSPGLGGCPPGFQHDGPTGGVEIIGSRIHLDGGGMELSSNSPRAIFRRAVCRSEEMVILLAMLEACEVLPCRARMRAHL